MVALQIFGIKIYWYGIFYAIAFIVGYTIFYLIGKSRIFQSRQNLQNLITKGLDDLTIAIILGVLIGGRLGHVLIYDLPYYLHDPIKIFYIWHGGMGFVGGVIGVVFAMYIIKRIYKLTWDDFLVLIDIICSILPFGIMIGRIGNYLNQELFGRIISQSSIDQSQFLKTMQDINLIHTYEKIDSLPRINTNLLESMSEGFLLFAINQYLFRKSKWKPGFISASFLIGYGIIRFIMEFLREYGDIEYIGAFTKTQYLMIGFIGLGIYLILRGKNSDNNI